MKTAILAAAILVGATGAAMAQGRPYTWTGLYVGIQGAHVSGTAGGTLGYDDPAFPTTTAADIFASTKTDIDVKGFMGGITAGYNWQSGAMVWGVEADIAGGDVDGNKSVTTKDTFTTWHMDTKLYSLGTLRGRVGYTSGPLLMYGTAGLAWGLAETGNAIECVGCPITPWGTGSSKESHWGFAAGGGLEWAISQGWTVKGEYLYVQLNDAKHVFKGTAHSGLVPASTPGMFVYESDSLNHDLQLHMFRLGLNYRFN